MVQEYCIKHVAYEEYEEVFEITHTVICSHFGSFIFDKSFMNLLPQNSLKIHKNVRAFSSEKGQRPL